MQKYSLVQTNGKNGYCKHVNGGFLTVCSKVFASNSSIRKCATFCTRQSSCVGFDVGSFDGAYGCRLFPADNTCPNGFGLVGPNNNAETISDLVAVGSPNYFCYGKNLGM